MWTLPNLLSLARIAVLPALIALIWPGIEGRPACFWAAVIYALASFTDAIDGILARRLNKVTVLGKFLDPLADKLFYLVPMVVLLQMDPARIPLWIVLIVLVRELTITGLRAIAMSEGIVIAAGEGGKLKTFFGSIGMFALLVHYPYLINFGVTTSVVDFHRLGLWITYLSVAFSLASAFEYLSHFLRSVKGTATSP